MSIRLKILLACLALVTITSALGGFDYLQERELGSLATDIYDNAVVGVSYAEKARTDFVRLAGAVENGKPMRPDLVQTLVEELGVARERAITPSARAFAGRIRDEIPKLLHTASHADLNRRLNRLDGELGDLATKFTADSFIYRVRTDRAVARTRLWAEIAFAAAVIFALICAALLEIAIVPPIRRAVAIATAIAAGDLQSKIPRGSGRSETSRLLRALAAMQQSIAESARRAEALRTSEAARIAAEYETDAARRANRAKSEFLATMSHELRTPLNAILGFSEMIREQIVGPVPPAYAAYADDIHSSGRHLLDLINDILDVSKLEAGRFELHEGAVAVKEVIAECLSLVRNQAERASVALVEEISPRVPIIEADARLLKQIVLNLLSNAIKFTPAGGQVSVKLAPAGNDHILFAISDTGIGMSPKEIEVALTPFGQINSKIARRQKGTGLGLAITRSLVELHKGILKVESKPGAGTVVSVMLPLSRRISEAA